jgi:hypothetical protein
MLTCRVITDLELDRSSIDLGRKDRKRVELQSTQTVPGLKLDFEQFHCEYVMMKEEEDWVVVVGRMQRSFRSQMSTSGLTKEK